MTTMKVDSPKAQTIARAHSSAVAERLRDGNVSTDDLAWAEMVVGQFSDSKSPKKIDASALRDAISARLKEQGPELSGKELTKDRTAAAQAKVEADRQQKFQRLMTLLLMLNQSK